MNVTKKALLVAKAIAFATILNGQAKIVIKGSDTLGAKMIPKLAEAYENKNPEQSLKSLQKALQLVSQLLLMARPISECLAVS